MSFFASLYNIYVMIICFPSRRTMDRTFFVFPFVYVTIQSTFQQWESVRIFVWPPYIVSIQAPLLLFMAYQLSVVRIGIIPLRCVLLNYKTVILTFFLSPSLCITPLVICGTGLFSNMPQMVVSLVTPFVFMFFPPTLTPPPSLGQSLVLVE